MAEKQYVVFRLHTGEYGIDIKDVQEIVAIHDITKVPEAPALIEGVIQVRGRIIPVVDLKKRFYGINEATGEDSRIIIMDMGGQPVGIITDDVWEVPRIKEELIEPPSPILKKSADSGVTGIAKLENRLIIILDIGRVFTMEEKNMLDAENLNITASV